MAHARQILFRLFYSTSFTILFFILVAFICVSPADAIYESYKRRRNLDIFLISGVYVVTALFAALIYASRLYTNRSVLREIPKSFLPIEKEDLPGKRVHRLIEECLARSAVTAYQARPRSKRIEHENETTAAKVLALTKSRATIDLKAEPRWGKIDHPGWSSPAAKEIAGLEYATVVDELLDLVEAKAVSLVPIDPLAPPGPDGMPLPDSRIIDALTRHEATGMRQYLQYLIAIEVVPDTSLTETFLLAYERARFSATPLAEQEFQALMRMFAELLRSMVAVNVELLDLEEASYGFPSLGSSMLEGNQGSEPDRDGDSNRSTISDEGSVRKKKFPPRRRHPEDTVPSRSSFEQDHAQNTNSKHTPQPNLQHHSAKGAAASSDSDDSDDEGSLSRMHSLPTPSESNASTTSLQTAPTTGQQSRSRSRLALQSTSRFVSATSGSGLGLGLGLRTAQSRGSLRSNQSQSRSSMSRLGRTVSGISNSTFVSGSSSSSSDTGSVIRLARPDETERTGLPFFIRGTRLEG
jgi:hypothetical protein